MAANKWLQAAVIFLATSFGAFSQSEVVTKAQVDVVVVDMRNNPRNGEEVYFDGANSKQRTTANTNKYGKVSVHLPTGDDYTISVKSMPENAPQSTLSIPVLKEGETLSGAYKINIVYEPSRTINLDNVQFDVAKATLRPGSYKDLQNLVEYMKGKIGEKIEIGGHTDSSGIEEKNVILSQQRADAIKEYLVKNGIPADEIIAKGYGSTQPIADNQTPEGKQKNRRIEVRKIVNQ